MDRVNETLRLAIGFCIIYSLLVALVLMVFGRQIAALFDGDDLVISYALLFFIIVPPTYALANLVNGWASAFNAMGKPQFSFAMIVIKMIFLMIPAVYFAYHAYGVVGLFIAMAVVNIITGMGVHLWASSICRKKTNQLQQNQVK